MTDNRPYCKKCFESIGSTICDECFKVIGDVCLNCIAYGDGGLCANCVDNPVLYNSLIVPDIWHWVQRNNSYWRQVHADATQPVTIEGRGYCKSCYENNELLCGKCVEDVGSICLNCLAYGEGGLCEICIVDPLDEAHDMTEDVGKMWLWIQDNNRHWEMVANS